MFPKVNLYLLLYKHSSNGNSDFDNSVSVQVCLFCKEKLNFLFPFRLHFTDFSSSCSELVGENTSLILSLSLSPRADVRESYVCIKRKKMS